MKIKSYPTLLLALMGLLDCVTTVIGTMRYGAVELNPIMSGLMSANMGAFVVLKLATTFSVCLIFVQADRILMKTGDKTTRSFAWANRILKVAISGVIVFLCLVVANNLAVLANVH